jgi:predicted phage terminase large subunit-like protein
MTIDPNDLQSMMNAILRLSFPDFVQKACSIAGSTIFRAPPHLALLCAYLREVHNRRTRRLIINMPPRTFKSFICTSCFSAWHLGHFPNVKVMIISHDQKLSAFLADQIRTIMQTDWYCNAFSTRLRDNYDRQMHFQTTEGGGVFATSIEGGLTGHGADIIILDDPLDAGDASSAVMRKRVNDLYDAKISSRLDDQANGAIMVVAQRLHVEDLPGHLLARGDFDHLCLPLVAPQKHTFSVGDFRWERAEDDVLDPTQFSPDVIASLRLAAQIFESQYQQAPTIGVGTLLRRDWFQAVDAATPACRRVLSFDLSQSSGEGSSYSCCLSFLSDGTNHYLEDALRKKGNYPEIKDWVLSMLKRYDEPLTLIEDAAFGVALIPELQALGHNVIAIKRPTTSKSERALPHLGALAAGRVRLLRHGAGHEAFLTEVAMFPEGNNDDQVDALTQFLAYMKEHSAPIPPKLIATSPPKRAPGAGSHPMRDPKYLRMRGRALLEA